MSKIIYIPLLVQDKYLKVDIFRLSPKLSTTEQGLVYVINSQFLVKKQVLNL